MPNPGRESEMLRCRVALGTTEKMKAIASQLGLYWGEEPQVSAVIEAIAQHEEVIIPLLKSLKKDVDTA